MLLPTTRTELMVLRLMEMPSLAVAAGAPGVRVMQLSTTMKEGSEMRIRMYLEKDVIGYETEAGVPRALREGRLGKVIVCAVDAPVLLMIRTGPPPPDCSSVRG